MKLIKENKVLFSAVFLFLILILPFINTMPYLDGNIDFVQTIDFYSGGLDKYFANWNTVHPPLKLLLSVPFYTLLGISAMSYSIPGIMVGILGICAIYLLTRNLFDQKTAGFAAILFSIYPLLVANSIFMMRDFLMTVLIVLSLALYSKNKMLLFAFACSLAVITKESALLLPISIIVVEVILLLKKFTLNRVVYFFVLLIPFISYVVWKLILNLNNKNSWNEWIFSETKNKGVISTIINNLLSLEFINPYAGEHWKQLIFLNFNWVYLLIILMGISFFFIKRNSKPLQALKKDGRVLSVIIVFIISYLFTVLTLQTFTIPRYALPVIPFLLIALAKSITVYKNKYIESAIFILILIFMSVSLFYSVDPIASRIWGRTQIFNQKLYSLNSHLAGNDGITYNVQYLLIASARSREILKADKKNKNVTSSYCQWIFPDPNNDIKMLKTLNLKIQPKCFYSN